MEAAFRTVPVALSDRHLGFQWQGLTYVETCLSFGLRTAPFIFNLFAEAFEWILASFFRWIVRHYLDDFIFILRAGAKAAEIRAVHDDYDSITFELGWPQNRSKDQSGTKIDVLGIEVDTWRMEARLPPKKLAKALHQVSQLLTAGRASMRDTQSVTGLLSFCSKAVRLSRTHLRHL